MGNATSGRAGRLHAGEILEEMALTVWYLRAILIGLLLLFVLLTIGMYYWGAPVETANRTPSTMGETVYFCAITALTIGYGDVVPTSTFGRIDAVCLGLIGLVFTGLFVAAAVRGVQEAAHRAEADGNADRVEQVRR
ncbi:potassium channel family protein [Paraburkholderia sp. HD33-4]|uniref:potassium channel family protein n=1 Tax=Paraburkholderia sp. HD33-4 TaxID=2883242 RepID=UPI001F2E0F2C|nr:potassium channel family protein [Paraburkholderia sp. HD33-4]